jgi:hypothetical protein
MDDSMGAVSVGATLAVALCRGGFQTRPQKTGFKPSPSIVGATGGSFLWALNLDQSEIFNLESRIVNLEL